MSAARSNSSPWPRTYYLLARINATAARTDPRRWPASIALLRDAFELKPSFRQEWFAHDVLFAPNKAEILEQINQQADW